MEDRKKRENVRTAAIFIGVAVLCVVISAAVFSALSHPSEGSVGIIQTDAQSERGSADGKPLTFFVAGRDSAAGLCDVLMLVRFEPQGERMTVLQIPRDTYAEYTDGSYRKLNGVLSHLKDPVRVCELLSDAMGIDIDGYVCFDTDTFSDAVDLIGGVEIELSEPLDYEDPDGGLYIHLRAGRQVLDGEAALKFVRYRSGYARGDIGRMDAQKLFLASLARKARALDGASAARVVTSVLSRVDTDISVKDALSLMRTGASIPEENIAFLTLPGEEAVAKRSGASYYSLSARACEEIMSELFGAPKGSFDTDGIFLNESYESFRDIYNGYSEYRLYRADELCGDGISIE